MKKAKRVFVLFTIISATAVLCGGCAKQYKDKEAELNKPINCAHAEGDIRVLQSEKTHVGEQIKAGVQAIIPVSLIGGLATGTEGTKAKIATGEYNKLIDKKIMEIKDTCGVE